MVQDRWRFRRFGNGSQRYLKQPDQGCDTNLSGRLGNLLAASNASLDMERHDLLGDVSSCDTMAASRRRAQVNRDMSSRPVYFIVKRGIDIVGASFALLLFAPVILAVWSVLLFTTRGNPFFRQTRAGWNGQNFEMLKFRTMIPGAHLVRHLVENEQEGPIFKNQRDPRITWLGRFLRATSIDEMPQLLNVLRGDMSLVGPRPLPVGEMLECEEWQQSRLVVRPGLTCLWQVSGRSKIGFEDWMRMDVWYVNNQSLFVDLVLLALTPWTVLRCRGAY